MSRSFKSRFDNTDNSNLHIDLESGGEQKERSNYFRLKRKLKKTTRCRVVPRTSASV